MAEFHRCDRCLEECGGGEVVTEEILLPNWKGGWFQHGTALIKALIKFHPDGWEQSGDFCLLCKVEMLQAVHTSLLESAKRGAEVRAAAEGFMPVVNVTLEQFKAQYPSDPRD